MRPEGGVPVLCVARQPKGDVRHHFSSSLVTPWAWVVLYGAAVWNDKNPTFVLLKHVSIGEKGVPYDSKVPRLCQWTHEFEDHSLSTRARYHSQRPCLEQSGTSYGCFASTNW